MKAVEAVSKRVKEIMEKTGATVKEVSKKAGLAETTVYKVLKATNKTIRITTVWRLCKGLEVGFLEFLTSPYFEESL
ncbi:MAG: helix-turn-helix transcriptional regulator [Clostridia bacterium]|nr:helix-turn-helix transcriptional regulator [Clostridia bacterium]